MSLNKHKKYNKSILIEFWFLKIYTRFMAKKGHVRISSSLNPWVFFVVLLLSKYSKDTISLEYIAKILCVQSSWSTYTMDKNILHVYKRKRIWNNTQEI